MTILLIKGETKTQIYIFFWDRVLLFSLGWPLTWDPLASASPVLKLQVCSTIQDFFSQQDLSICLNYSSVPRETTFSFLSQISPLLSLPRPQALTKMPLSESWPTATLPSARKSGRPTRAASAGYAVSSTLCGGPGTYQATWAGCLK
jgi:hypothetical protein